MADQPPRGRGRARGRARGAPAPAPAQPPAAAPQARAPSSGSSSSSSAPPRPVGRSSAQPRQQGAGDVASRVGAMTISGGGNGGNGNGGNGNGNGARPVGRGAVRPSRDGGELLLTRPAHITSKQGTAGQTIKLTANYFEMKKPPGWSLCKHHVDVSDEDRTFMRKILLREHRDRFQGYLFDGSTLFTQRNACPNGKPLELVSTNREGKVFTLTIKFVGTVEPSDYQYLQVFNILLRESMGNLNLKEMRRNYFDPGAKIQVPEHKLELWPGYKTSIIPGENAILLQAEITYKVLRKDTAYDLLQSCANDARSAGQDIRTQYSNAVMGTTVITLYNNKHYRVDEVDFESNPQCTFPKKVKGETTNIKYMDYFQERYNLKCRDPQQPMLVSRKSARERRATKDKDGDSEMVYLIPEFCVMTGLTDNMRSNFTLMKAVNIHTCLAPNSRIQKLKDFNRRLNSVPAIPERMRQWGLELRPSLVEIPDGRILPSETIVVADGRKYDAGRDANWDRNLRSNKMLHGINIDKWVILFQGRSSRETQEFCKTLSKVAQGMQYQIASPFPYELNSDRAADYVNTLERAINERNPQIVMCVVPNNRTDRYSAIKKKCIVDRPMSSQVILYKTITNKGIMSIATKVAIQMNCKMGGAPWAVEIPLDGLMVVGYDVCHDPTDKRRSYGAMVATLDRSCAHWYSNVTRHSAGEELSINFALGIQKCVAKYVENNKKLPNIILIYRDGVGDGQIEYVKDVELKLVQEKLNPEYEKAGKPLRLGFIIVTKRINTRIFYGEQNPPPGTIVDSTVTNPRRYDFFLISQNVRQGTVSPTHYNVIFDSAGVKPDHIQRLTYKLTHLYYNWSGTVRVPAPCQYAHKLAFLTAQNVGMVHSNLDRLLYYL